MSTIYSMIKAKKKMACGMHACLCVCTEVVLISSWGRLEFGPCPYVAGVLWHANSHIKSIFTRPSRGLN
jgi:hypothetical protein